MASLQERVIGALRLEPKTFEEVEADQNATGQAMMVVVASAVAAGIGSIGSGLGLGMLVFTLVGALVGWFVWAFLTFLIGTKLMPEAGTHADMGQMLRVLGFAAAPGLFGILRIIPFLGWIIGFLVMVWQLMAMVVAVRQALDYSSTGRAVLVCLIGWVVYLIIMAVFGVMAGGMAMMGRGF